MRPNLSEKSNSFDYMCIHCGQTDLMDESGFDYSCSSDSLTDSEIDDITTWIKDDHEINATDYCFTEAHLDVIYSNCFCHYRAKHIGNVTKKLMSPESSEERL